MLPAISLAGTYISPKKFIFFFRLGNLKNIHFFFFWVFEDRYGRKEDDGRSRDRDSSSKYIAFPSRVCVSVECIKVKFLFSMNFRNNENEINKSHNRK